MVDAVVPVAERRRAHVGARRAGCAEVALTHDLAATVRREDLEDVAPQAAARRLMQANAAEKPGPRVEAIGPLLGRGALGAGHRSKVLRIHG